MFYKLSSLCLQICDGVHNTVIDSPNDKYYLLSAKNIKNGTISYTNEDRQISFEMLKKLNKRTKMTKGDVLLTTVGTIGETAIVQEEEKFEFQRSVGIIKPDLTKISSKYLFYYLRLPSVQYYLKSTTTGAAQPCLFLGSINKLKINIVDTDKQNRITRVLSKYDELIENNKKQISALEQMADLLYKEWFVHFRYPGYENSLSKNDIPSEWAIVKLRDIAEEKGLAIASDIAKKKKHYLPIDCLPSKSMSLKEETSIADAESSLVLFKDKDILFGSMRPYFHKVILSPFEGVTRKTCFVINSKNRVFQNYLYLTLFQKSSVDFANTVSVGSTMPYVRWKDLARMNLVFPSERIINQFNKLVEPILNKLIGYYAINSNLMRQRDLLLPRLMSGKLAAK